MRRERSCSRRGFFQAFAVEALSAVREVNGIPQCRVEELYELPDAVLARMVPTPGPPGPFRCEEGRVVRVDERGRVTPVRVFTESEDRALRLFDGRRSLGAIAAELSEGRGRDEAFRVARVLFCDLAQWLVFVPASSHREDAGNAGGFGNPERPGE